MQLESGGEARFRIVGIVRALETDGRVAYVRPDRLLSAGAPRHAADRDPLAARRRPRAHRPALSALGATPTPIAGATSSNREILATLASLLRVVALVTGLVCLYALVQGLTVVALERRGTIAVLRAGGAGAPTVVRLLLGVVLVAAVPAALLGLVVESVALAPLVGNLAAGYADLVPRATVAESLVVAAGLALLCVLAALVVARRALRGSIVEGLRGG